MPGDGVDLLGEDGVEDAPQEDVEVAQQEEEHGHGLGRLRGIWERAGAPCRGLLSYSVCGMLHTLPFILSPTTTRSLSIRLGPHMRTHAPRVSHF